MSVEHASSSHGKEQEAPVAQLKPGAVLHAHGDVPRIRHERLQVGVTRLPQGHSLLLRSQQPLARVPRARPDTHSGAVPMRSPRTCDGEARSVQYAPIRHAPAFPLPWFWFAQHCLQCLSFLMRRPDSPPDSCVTPQFWTASPVS